jgi:hypothetical protein
MVECCASAHLLCSRTVSGLRASQLCFSTSLHTIECRTHALCSTLREAQGILIRTVRCHREMCQFNRVGQLMVLLGVHCSESGLWGGPCIIPPEQAAAWESAQTLTSKHNTVNADDGETRTVLSFRMAIGECVITVTRVYSSLL